MNRAVFGIVVASLLLSICIVCVGRISAASASPDVYYGDLILDGNNVTIIEGTTFDINGSIVITENATLILQNSVLNFTQTSTRQFNMSLNQAADGNPRLLAYNSTITSAPGLEYLIYALANSSATINNSTVSGYLDCIDESVVTILNSSYVDILYGYSSSTITVINSEVREWHNYDSPQVEVYGSTIDGLVTGATSVNCTVSNLQAGYVDYWNFLSNSSVLLNGGYCPNVTLVNSRVDSWRFAFYGHSNALVIDSTVQEAAAISYTGFTTVNLTRSNVTNANCYYSNELWAHDSLIESLYAVQLSTARLFNTSCNTITVEESATVYVNWYLDVQVTDALHQGVPLANVTVAFPNATLADTKLTDDYGRVRFALAEEMINATAQYPTGNYTVDATYLIHSNSTTVNMSTNHKVELMFEELVIPEFPSLLTVLLIIIATTLTAVATKKKRSRLSAR